MEPSGRYDVVVFSIIDWDFRFQRPQQLATQFGRHGHRVFYLSTTQFLAPGGGPAWDLARKAENVGELRIRSRRALDIYRGTLDAADLDVLVEAFEELAADLAMGDAVCLVQIPFWAPLAERLRERLGWQVVYDCMDEWTNFPGFGAERALARGGAGPRRRRHDRLGRPPLGEVEGHGASARSWPRTASTPSTTARSTRPNDAARRRARIRSSATTARSRRGSTCRCSRRSPTAHPDATIVLAGGHFDVDLSPDVRARRTCASSASGRTTRCRKLLWNFDVCVIPFLVNDITEATNPVKFYEYLYGGKPVVAPALTELLPYATLSYLARGATTSSWRSSTRALAGAGRRPAPRRAPRGGRGERLGAPLRGDRRGPDRGAPARLGRRRHLRRPRAHQGLPRVAASARDLAAPRGHRRRQRLLRRHARVPARRRPRRTRACAASYNPENRGFAAANNQGIARGARARSSSCSTTTPSCRRA